MFKEINFQSERLFVNNLNEEDFHSLFEIYSDKEAMKFRGSQSINTLEDAAKMISDQLTVEKRISKLRLAIRLKTSNQLIGTMLLVTNEEQEFECEVGFSFGKMFWGNGCATETLQMIESTLLEKTDVTQLKAWCVEGNFASIRIFQKAGYEEVVQGEYPKSKLFRKALS